MRMTYFGDSYLSIFDLKTTYYKEPAFKKVTVTEIGLETLNGPAGRPDKQLGRPAGAISGGAGFGDEKRRPLRGCYPLMIFQDPSGWRQAVP